MHISALKAVAETRPFVLVIGLFVAQAVLPFGFVLPFRVLGLDITALRLIIQAVELVLMLWIIWHLGWNAPV